MLDGSEFLAGLKVATKELKDLQKEIRLEDVGNAVEVAQSFAPVGTGDEDVPGELRDSIGVIEETDDYIDWGTTLEYAPEVEYGNTKDRPQPFMRPAMESLKRG